MIETPRILVFAGSLRAGSYNKIVSRLAARGAKQAGAEVTWIDLADFPMPPMDLDIEATTGIPENGKRLKELIASHNALIISSPEHNASIPAVLKNAIDWASRAEGANEGPGSAFRGKVVALMSATPGGYGGVRAVSHLRDVLGHVGMVSLPSHVHISGAANAFTPEGEFVDHKNRERVEAVAHQLVEVARRLN